MNFAISPTRMQILATSMDSTKHLGPGLLHPLLQHEALRSLEVAAPLSGHARAASAEFLEVRKHRGTAATGLAYGRDDHIHSSAFDRLASALRDRRTREYRPGSETTDIFLFAAGGVDTVAPFPSSPKAVVTSPALPMPRQAHTSRATNHRIPPLSTTRTCLNLPF